MTNLLGSFGEICEDNFSFVYRSDTYFWCACEYTCVYAGASVWQCFSTGFKFGQVSY